MTSGWTKFRMAGGAMVLAAALAVPGRSAAPDGSVDGFPSAAELGGVMPVSCDEAYGSIDCGECCGCGDCCCGDACCGTMLGGLVLASDHRFDDFISPITNPVFFEDPRSLTELRPIFIQHAVPATAGGGDIQLYALQFRARVTERLSIVAPKDGYAVSTNPLIADGWADVAAGLKYQLFADPANQRLAAAGLIYTMPVGSTRTLQGRGDGDFQMFLTGGAEILGYGHVVSCAGARLPADDNRGTQMAWWSTHLDYQVLRRVYALTEINWYNWMKSGENGIPGVEGGDLFNIGSPGVAENDIVTGALGAKYKPNRNAELGIAWEVPLTERRDVIEWRLGVDAILRF